MQKDQRRKDYLSCVNAGVVSLIRLYNDLKRVIPAKAGIQVEKLDSESSPE